MKLGFAGLGRMGRRMAANCANAGMSVTVWNRSPEPAEAFVAQGLGQRAANPTELAGAVDIVVSMLANDEAAEQVYLGPDGLISATGATTLVEMGTMSPALIAKIGQAADAAGKAFCDAPVSGATEAAQDAKLLIMAGGKQADFAVLAPVFDAIGRHTVWLGKRGDGAVMKLAVNMLIHGLNQTVSEALTLASASGIDDALAFDVIENSVAAAPMLSYRRPVYLDEAAHEVTFTVDLAAKDVGFALDLAQKNGVAMPQTEVTLQVLRSAIAANFGSRDMASIFNFMKGKTR